MTIRDLHLDCEVACGRKGSSHDVPGGSISTGGGLFHLVDAEGHIVQNRVGDVRVISTDLHDLSLKIGS